MRESDWSSDVCSSDLHAETVPSIQRKLPSMAHRRDRAGRQGDSDDAGVKAAWPRVGSTLFSVLMAAALAASCCLLRWSFWPPALHAAEAPEGQKTARFFRMGDGRLHIANMHDGRKADVRLLGRDGAPDEASLAALDRVFGFPGKSGDHISPRLLFLLDYFSDKVAPGRTIELHSGYRAPAYNLKLRRKGGVVAPASTHMDAMAIDFSIRGRTARPSGRSSGMRIAAVSGTMGGT
jgi:uncharacterized protein YcbK (DUF882 family)